MIWLLMNPKIKLDTQTIMKIKKDTILVLGLSFLARFPQLAITREV